MADKNQNNQENDYPDSSDNSPFSSPKENINSGGQEIKPESGNEKNDKKDCHTHPNIIINVPPNNDAEMLAEAKRANKYTRRGLIINTCLFLATLAALVFTWWSIDISNQALSDSRRKDKLDSVNRIKYDSIAKDERDTANKRSRESYYLAQQSVDAQIKSLKETQNQFDLINTPYLECNNFQIFVFGANTRPEITFNIQNFGKVSAKVIKYRYRLIFSDRWNIKPHGYLKDVPYNNIPNQFYVSTDKTVERTYQHPEKIDAATYHKFEVGIAAIFYGEIIYENSMDKQNRRCIFSVLFDHKHNTQTVHYIENIDIPPIQ